MRRKLSYLWFVLPFALCALVVSLTGGCAAKINVTALPTGVTSTQVNDWNSAVQDLSTISASVAALSQSTLFLCESPVAAAKPLITPGACKLILTDLGKANSLEIAASGFLQGVPKSWNQSISTQVQQWTSQIAALLIDITTNGVAGISNPTSVADVNQDVTAISNAISEIAAIT
jgi:hypothetical protein